MRRKSFSKDRMEVYVAHSTGIDFEDSLYDVLRDSKIAERHNFVFPHEDSDELFDSKKFLQNESDLMLAEVSHASTGLGIELGWADLFDVPVICVFRRGSDPSGSISAVCDASGEYEDNQELLELVENLIEDFS